MNNESPQGGASVSPNMAAAANGTTEQQQQQQQQNQKVQPQKLELILNPEDGSLQTAPLLYVVTACTDSLYRDIYDMAHGDVQIIGGGGSGGVSGMEGGGGGNDDAARRKDKMSNLSFAARRHELSYRLASHSKALTHVAALTASNNNNSSSSSGNNNSNSPTNMYTDGETANLARFVDVSTKALTHARTAWIQNDECQDAMYFFHGRLFSLRAGPHDVYGALDFMVRTTNNYTNNSEDKNSTDANTDADATGGKIGDSNSNTCTSFWYDLPSDLKLETDRYETSAEQQWSKQEVSDRWQMAVRRKLLLGEVGWMAARQQQHHQHQQEQHQHQQQPGIPSPNKGRIGLPTQQRLAHKIPWKISLKGGIVRLMHGKPKTTIDNTTGKTKTLYPLEAVLTVLTTDSDDTDDKDAAADKDKDKDMGGQDNDNGTSSSTVTATSSSTSTSQQQQQQEEEPTTKKSTGTIIAEDQAEWTLISVDVCAQAKTGQSNHQLDTTNKQRYNLHRLCALAMAREEKQNRLQKQLQQQQQHELTMTATVARPLNALFRVAQYFSLSWQLEILSEQAKALSKGNWGGGGAAGGRRESRSLGPSVSGGRRIGGNSSGSSHSIVVTPVKFFENRTSRILGVLSISFWAIDDRYGPPSMGDLVHLDEDDDEDDEDENKSSAAGANGNGGHAENDSVSTVSRSVQNPAVTNMLTLSVRAEPDVGIKVSLSGADSIMEFATHPNHGHVRSTIGDLLEATANPFALSASEALLAATILCAERKCYAMVEALPSVLPNWITLTVEKGNIVVAAKIQYYTNSNINTSASVAGVASSVSSSAEPVVLFRLACDSRTGSFVPTFSRSTPLLQHMACNDVRAASDTTLLRIANLSKLRRSRTPKAASAGAVFGSGRVVRDAFDSLSRSMNVLGQRTGVGGAWKDLDDRSILLRQRAIGLACRDVNVSLMSCCGMAVLYGLSAVSIGVATGIEASPEMAGGKLVLTELTKAAASLSLNTKVVSSFLLAPPPSLLIDQKLVEHASWTSDGERLKKSLSEQERFGICCSVDEAFGLTLYGAEIKTEIESPSSIPTRKEFELVAFANASTSNQDLGDESIVPPTKRAKTDGSSNAGRQAKTRDLIDEVEYFAAILSQTIGIG